MRLGFALGSGGARGWCHIGALLEMDEMGLKPDVVAGCSMGALVGAAYCSGRLGDLAEWAKALTRSKVIRLLDLDVRLRRGGLVQGNAIAEILTEIGVATTFEALERPLLVVATDMTTGREVWLQTGDLLDAVRASISIPGVFTPYYLEGRWLLDGGLVNPVPSSACRALGADVTIAINPNGLHGGRMWYPAEAEKNRWPQLDTTELVDRLPEPMQNLLPTAKAAAVPMMPGYLDVVSGAIDIMTEYLRKTREAGDPPHLLLQADLRTKVMVLELEKAAVAIDEGRRIVREQRDSIFRICEGT